MVGNLSRYFFASEKIEPRNSFAVNDLKNSFPSGHALARRSLYILAKQKTPLDERIIEKKRVGNGCSCSGDNFDSWFKRQKRNT
jgi:hypothetical protein